MPRMTPDNPVLATNTQAFHDYQIVERFEAGIQLTGTEVKSCRDRAIQLNDGYIKILNGQMFLLNVHISVYGFGNRFNHEVRRQRRLLMHKKEILKIAQWLGTRGGTVVPLRFYLKQGLIKVEIAYAQGKSHGDQRETLRKRDSEEAMRRSMRNHRS